MKYPIATLIALFIVINSVDCISDTVNAIATKSGLINKLQYQFMFPLKEFIGPSLELALTTCQESFKWNRWNCPSNDFVAKRSSKHFNRESAYVKAIITAALMYTITKSCSAGTIPGCGCIEDQNNEFVRCSDNLEYAEDVIGLLLDSRQEDSLDVQAYAALHNERLVEVILRRSLKRFCRCENDDLPCTEVKCWHSLRPFGIIAKDIREAYERAMLVNVDNKGEVSWKHIPEDVLVFVDDSPNYCNENAIPGWTGMRGRQCSRNKGKDISLQERFSCGNLCRSCGLRIRGQSVIVKKRCNCRLTSCCEVKCDMCVVQEKKHYCD